MVFYTKSSKSRKHLPSKQGRKEYKFTHLASVGKSLALNLCLSGDKMHHFIYHAAS